MKIIVSGGGTGGHIYPALTLVSVLAKKERTAEFLYVGTQKGLEADIIPKEGIPFETVDIEGLKRSFSPTNIVRLGRAMHGLAEAAAIVRRFRPDVVIGTGGYVCGPILMAASLAHVPTLIQEQNVVPGVTNKILSKFVTKIAVGTEEALCRFPRKKAVFTGNPIRREVMTASREKALEKFGFDAAKRTVLVSGGSRGARRRAWISLLRRTSRSSLTSTICPRRWRWRISLSFAQVRRGLPSSRHAACPRSWCRIRMRRRTIRSTMHAPWSERARRA